MSSIFDRAEFTEALFFPRPDASAPPPGATDRFVDSGGVRLHVRRHGSSRCTLLLFHGNGEVVADYDTSAGRFARAGASLAVADYRGYGSSEGTPTLRTLIADARAIATAVHAEVGGSLVVMGRSLGGVAAHELLADPIAGMVGVVLESAFFDLGALIRRRGLVPPREYTADELAMFEPATKLRRGRLPVLVLHGERDQMIAPREAESALAAAGSADKQLVLVPRRGHNDVSAEAVYWEALASFVARIVGA